jgi:hypothetical protein
MGRTIGTLLATSLLGLLTACGMPAPVLSGGLTFADGMASLARQTLGGTAYTAFKLAPRLPESAENRAAVKLTYLMNDDSGHQSPWSGVMLQAMDDWQQKRVHNVVFRDGGEMGDSRLYYLQQADAAPKTIGNPSSQLAPNVTEVQSNNPKVLSQILGWTFDHYPGKRKYLQLYTHGNGAMGVGMDERQTDPAGNLLPKEQTLRVMPMPAFAEALRQGLKGRQLDAIYFRACLMGNVEALYELRGTTRYAVASEDVSYSKENSNLTMPKLFDDLASRDVEPAEIARQLAIAANAKSVKDANGAHSGYTTMAAVDIGRMDELKTAINSLAGSLKAAMPTHRAAIVAAYDAVPLFNGEETPDKSYEQSRDLWAFTAQLQQKVNEPGVQRTVAQVRQAQKAAMLHERDSYGSNANGLSIFMPVRGSDATKWGPFLKDGYLQLRFAKDTGWNEFLTEILATRP